MEKCIVVAANRIVRFCRDSLKMAQLLTVAGQMRLYGFIARAVENLKKLGRDKITRGAIQSRLDNLESNWEKFQRADGDLYSEELSDSVKDHS